MSRSSESPVGCLGAATVMVLLLLWAAWESYSYSGLLVVLLVSAIFVALVVWASRSQNAADRAADQESLQRTIAADTVRTVDGFRNSDLRATDHDRELAAGLLTKALAAGSLGVDEYSERTATAAAAVHRSTLHECLKDLDVAELAGPPRRQS